MRRDDVVHKQCVYLMGGASPASPIRLPRHKRDKMKNPSRCPMTVSLKVGDEVRPRPEWRGDRDEEAPR